MRIIGTQTAAPQDLSELAARRSSGTAAAAGAADSARGTAARPTVASSGAPVADPADVMTRAASTHRATQVVAAQNGAAAASLASVPQAALAGLLPMPS